MAMAGERESGPQVDDPEAVKAEWLKCLNELAAQVKAWVEPTGWRTRLVTKSPPETRSWAGSRFRSCSWNATASKSP